MKIGIILETKELEKAWNALRFANTSLKRNHEIKLFLMGEAVECIELDSDKYGIQSEIMKFNSNNGIMLACGTCLKSRNQEATEACPLSTMIDCVEMVEWADKVLTF
ncbi:MAG: DsrE family protein [Fibrobacteres bacterium]|nr:DsrE family protein [Fibrobacterota bacterium]